VKLDVPSVAMQLGQGVLTAGRQAAVDHRGPPERLDPAAFVDVSAEDEGGVGAVDKRSQGGAAGVLPEEGPVHPEAAGWDVRQEHVLLGAVEGRVA